MNYHSVLAFGDSTTAGCELIKDSIDWGETKKLSFPNQIANHLNIPCYNYAWPGGSNDRSLRLLPEALIEHPNSLVLFTYTSFDRTEIFTTVDYMPQVKNEGYTGLGACWSCVNTHNDHQKLNDLYLRNFYENPDSFNRYKLYNTMLMVQLLCEKYSQNYLQIFLYNHIFLSPDYQESVFSQIDKSHIYQFDFANDKISWRENNEGFGSLVLWAKVKKYPFCPGGHIGQEAHNNFAKELIKVI